MTVQLEQVVESSRGVAELKGLDLRVHCPGDLVVQTDRVKLERLLLNLVSNGQKFTRAGGVRIDVTTADTGVTIRVIDTGEGIEPEYLARLFDEFYQAHNAGRDRSKGHGLGLSIAK